MAIERRGKTVGQYIWEAIARGGQAMQQQYPELHLSPVAARSKFQRETDQGKQLAELYRDWDARRLSPAEFASKPQAPAVLRALGAPSWSSLEFQPAVDAVNKATAALVEHYRKHPASPVSGQQPCTFEKRSPGILLIR